MDYDPNPIGLTGDALLLNTARQRYKRASEWVSEAYKNSLDDTKFANADSRNNWQWPDKVYSERTGEQEGTPRPCLTVNKARTHNDICINEAMRQKSSIKIRPTGGQASYESATTMQALIRRIEYVSKSTIGYRKAIGDQVDGGVGYVFLETGYVSDRSFDQEIYIKLCKDPRAVFLDPDADLDGLNADYGFIIEKIDRDKFNKQYPKFTNSVGKTTLGADGLWINEWQIHMAYYYSRVATKDTLIRFTDPASGSVVMKMASEISREAGPDLLDHIMEQIKSGQIDGKTREVVNRSVKWYRIAGEQIIESGDWAGIHIPIIPCYGRVTLIEGKIDIKSHTRTMIDAQRMLNYNASAFIEYGALQTKTPYVAPARAIEGQEQWRDANTKNYAVLAYNDVDEEATTPELAKIDRPQREPPPQSAPVYAEGMMSAERWMMMVSGQYQAQMGENDQQSAASGRAINERQRQGDTATWHFNEGQGDMFRALGTQLIDLIPKIYDTERRLHVLGEDGTKRWIVIKPDNQDALKELQKERDEAAILEFNPSVGEYECVADVGPNYATQRQEAWDALSQLLQQNIELASIMGDLYFKYGDFAGADELAERMKKEIQSTKPYLFADGQDPNVGAMQEQLQKLQALNGELMQKLADMQLRLRGKEEKRDIEAFNAETKRMEARINAMAKLLLTPQQRQQMEHDLTMRAHDHIFTTIEQANEAALNPLTQTNGAGNGANESP